ncbi:MAG TPA: MarR family transcriptional regulator [Opitutaceae bacterium]|jgi:DNA-binding MarR family transcriptional regulator
MHKEGAAGQSWSPESRAGYWINRSSRALLRAAEARLRPLGFSMGQLPVLRALADGQALSQRDLAREAQVEQPTMAELLARMERGGVIRRRANPGDRRGSLVSLTPRSRARLGKARTALAEAERVALAGLSADECRLLRDLLRRVAGNLETPVRLPPGAGAGSP